MTGLHAVSVLRHVTTGLADLKGSYVPRFTPNSLSGLGFTCMFLHEQKDMKTKRVPNAMKDEVYIHADDDKHGE